MFSKELTTFDAEVCDPSSADASPTKAGQNARFVFGIYVGTSGHLKVLLAGGSTVTFKNLPVGFHPMRIKTVVHDAVNTTATDLLFIYTTDAGA